MLFGHTNSDYAENIDTRKSLTWYIFTMYGTTISWKAMLRSVMASSITEAEYIVVIENIKEFIWLRTFINDLGLDKQSVIHYDNQSVVYLSKRQVFHERTRHNDVRLHFVRNMIDPGIVQVIQ